MVITVFKFIYLVVIYLIKPLATRKLILPILFFYFILSCKNEVKTSELKPENSSEILFQIKTNDKDDLEFFEDGIMPWISIKNTATEISNLIGKDDIVINKNSVITIIDYPLNIPINIELKSNSSNRFTREAIALQISTQHIRTYKEKEESAKTKIVPLEERIGLINGNQTDGKYGIWGHDSDDLNLSAIVIKKLENGELLLELIIES